MGVICIVLALKLPVQCLGVTLILGSLTTIMPLIFNLASRSLPASWHTCIMLNQPHAFGNYHSCRSEAKAWLVVKYRKLPDLSPRPIYTANINTTNKGILRVKQSLHDFVNNARVDP
jgi:hypothetical protein